MADEKKTASAPKTTRTQKPIYAVLQVLGTDGAPIAIDKSQIVIVGGYRNADGVLDAVESGKYPNAVYKKVSIG